MLESGQLLSYDPLAGIFDPDHDNPNYDAGGDLSGTYPNPRVVGLRGVPLADVAPSSGQALVFSGSSWAPGTVSGGVSQHASTHLSGAADPIDGDKLLIEYEPNFYTPVPDGYTSTSEQQLAAHLWGLEFFTSNHGTRHHRTGGDPIDGDRIDIDFIPTGYTPTVTASVTTYTEELSSHLHGISRKLTTLSRSDIGVLAGVQRTDQSTFYAISAFALDLTGSFTALFQPIIEVFPSGAIAIARLYNVTTMTEVASSVLTGTSLVPTRLSTPNLSSSLAAGSNVYELQLRLAATGDTYRAICKGATLTVNWS
jgi:hypothetical protein